MKKATTLLFALFTATISISSLSAQVSATASATATIITPISISKVADMNFGNVAVQSSTSGTVVMTPAGVRSTTGGVTLPAIAGTLAAATFTVTGLTDYTYAITLPSSAITISSGGNSMTVTNFISTPSGSGTLALGSQTLNVGATLNVAAAQAPGTYVSGTPFTVTVNYN